jgi:hypothetical protein
LEKGLLFLGFEIFKANFSKPVALFRIPFCPKIGHQLTTGLLAMQLYWFSGPARHPQ